MEIGEAVRKAAQILNEERVRPTVGYEPVEAAIPAQVADSSAWVALAALGHMGKRQQLASERKQRPRVVHESPDEYRFKSINYELLLALFSQVGANDRDQFLEGLLSRVSGPCNNHASELPLVAEFCIRVGSKRALLRAIAEAKLTSGLVVFLTQVEDAIALNFNLFTDTELGQLATTLHNVRTAAHRTTYQSIRQRGGTTRAMNPDYNPLVAPVATKVVAICDGIIRECNQAEYFYLKGALQGGANLEVNHDKTRVEDYLKNLGFSDPLLQALNAAEQDYRASATPFELKSCLGHLRSFLEGLHEQASQAFARKTGTTVEKRWGRSTEFLVSCGALSPQEEGFATSLYTLISDEGVHPLIAEREYSRLLRNVVIEYGLLFLAKLGRAGVKLH